MERRDGDLHRLGCSIAKQTILTTHPSGLQTRVSVELANFDSLCLHHSECKPKKPVWGDGSPFMGRRGLLSGGVSAHATPVLGRKSDAVNEGRLSQQCTPVMRRRELTDSPGGSPMMARRGGDDGDDEVCDVDSVISGWLKFRDNKRWKSRWGVVTKLSPAAEYTTVTYEKGTIEEIPADSREDLNLDHQLPKNYQNINMKKRNHVYVHPASNYNSGYISAKRFPKKF